MYKYVKDGIESEGSIMTQNKSGWKEPHHGHLQSTLIKSIWADMKEVIFRAGCIKQDPQNQSC